MSSNSVDSDEMTVEDENRRNSETDDIHSILENFMQAKEESLEELVGGFMYLTMDDVMQKASNTARAIASNSNTDVFRGGDVDTTGMLKGVAAPECGEVKVDSKREKREGRGEQSGDIEEEVLEDGSSRKRSGEDALFRHRPASLTKFDNFMLDDEEPESDSGKEDGDGSKVNKEEEGEEREEGEGEEKGEEEDWLPTSGYMASFAADDASSQDPQTPDIPAASNPKPAMQQKPAEADSLSSHNTLSQLMSLGPDTRSQLQAAEGTDVDTGDGGQISRGAPLTMSDTADALCDPSSTVCDPSSTVCDADVEAPPAWTLNPGEAEEEITALPVEQRVSVIEISARVVSSLDAGQSDGDAGSQAGEEECDDDVVPFQLDKDYDYDSIVYTPKFTPQEMSYLNSFLPKKS